MITKNDCIILLTDLESKGIDTKNQVEKLLKENNILDTLKFINNNRQLDLTQFYEHIRQTKLQPQKISAIYKYSKRNRRPK